jgi:ribonuclease BN (tRNA processing enzyme)
MRLTVLGKSPAWQDAGGACSGYLVEDGDTRLLMDAGNGVFGKLRARVDYLEVDAVVVSHLHADHFLDLVPFAYALTYGPRQPAERVRPVLHAPPGARDVFSRIVGCWGDGSLIEKAFDLREYDPGEPVDVGSLRLTFQPVPHYTETFAICLESSRGGGRIVYGADSRPAEELIGFAQGASLVLMEATLRDPEPHGPRGHLTAAEAGEHARAAGAGRLVLVHISDELDAERSRSQAADSFQGPVEVAAEGTVYEV